jgi:catechol 2,3-dioxygenase
MLALHHLRFRVRDPARLADFYRSQLGFALVGQTTDRVELAAEPGGPVLLTLESDPTAIEPSADAAGLFHGALLLPTRASLGAWLRHAIDAGVEFDGLSNHGVSEAIYLTDPEGNGLEFYADRPKAMWPMEPNGEIGMFTRSLAVADLLAAAAAPGGAPLAGARWGHLHLRVTDLDRSEKFYRDALGLILTQSSYPGARFLAANGYHHHIGLNSWGRPRKPQPAGAFGLAEATFSRPGAATEEPQRDPDGIAIRMIGGPIQLGRA